MVGKLAIIVLDADREGGIPEEEVHKLGRRITFSTADGRLDLRPVAVSLDQQEVLLPFGLPKELPKIPRPGWPGPSVFREPTPWVEQRYEERASGKTMLLDSEWLIFRPVHKILMASTGFFRGISWPKLVIKPDVNGEHMALLLNAETGEAHFVGGRFEPLTRQERPQEPMVMPAM